MKWTCDEVSFLRENYETKGPTACAALLGRKASQVRNKAWELGLKSSRRTEARIRADEAHGVRLTGRRRPEHSETMKRRYAEGRVLQVRETPEQISTRVKAWLSVNHHPRGMAGKKHSDETRRALTAALRAAPRPRAQRRNVSWRGGYRTIGDRRVYFRSAWEANYARHLNAQKASGAISDWEYEPFTFSLEANEPPYSATPDFLVRFPDGRSEFHEVKGWLDERSKRQLRLLSEQHGALCLVLIDSKVYSRLKADVATAEGWEP